MPGSDCTDAVCRLIEDDGLTYGSAMKVLTVGRDSPECDSFRYRIVGVEQI